MPTDPLDPVTGGALTATSLGLKVKLYDPLEHYNNDAAAWVGFGD